MHYGLKSAGASPGWEMRQYQRQAALVYIFVFIVLFLKSGKVPCHLNEKPAVAGTFAWKQGTEQFILARII